MALREEVAAVRQELVAVRQELAMTKSWAHTMAGHLEGVGFDLDALWREKGWDVNSSARSRHRAQAMEIETETERGDETEHEDGMQQPDEVDQAYETGQK